MAINKCIIFGCGGHARSVIDVLINNNWEIPILVVDDMARENEMVFSYPTSNNYVVQKEDSVFFAIGNNEIRKKMYEEYEKCNGSKMIMTVISKDAYIGIDAKIGKGSFIAHNVFLGPNVKVGKNTIINTAAIIEHEVIVGENSHIAPRTVVCGRSKIGDNVFIGAGSTIVDKVKICDNVIIGAGAVVVTDICEEGTYVGNPARKKGRR